jgi:transcriptional repressor NrdR
MVCIYCGKDTKVTNSRYKTRLKQVWRRRQCLKCGANFTTNEVYDLKTALIVIKKDGSTEPFQRDKLLLSIARSLDHIQNSPQTSSDLTDTVLRHMLESQNMKPNISTTDISFYSSRVLKRFNAASSIKYLSFQQKLPSVNDVKKSLRS